MKFFKFLFLTVFCSLSAQKSLPFDSLQLKNTSDFFADDYGNIYLYKNSDFSFSKYDSLGKQNAKLMLTLPFKIQSVQNPLNIPSFSENAQELKFFDQNLIDVQTINFRQKFGFIRSAFLEDSQQAWLLDDSSKRLIQYNFREDQIVNAFSFVGDFEKLLDLLIYDKKVYLLYQNELQIFNLKSEKIASIPTISARKLRRENRNILILTNNSIQKVVDNSLKTIFDQKNAQIVDKNSLAYFVIKDNKLYLYPIEKDN